jgi:hypothetical protein
MYSSKIAVPPGGGGIRKICLYYLLTLLIHYTLYKYLKNSKSNGVHLLKYDIQGCMFKMCPNFTYEVVGQRRRLKAIKKYCTSKIKCHFIFWQNFLNIFSEFYMKSVSSWLTFCRAFQGHPVSF